MFAFPLAISQIQGIGFGFGQFAMFATWSLAFWYGSQVVSEGHCDFGEFNAVRSRQERKGGLLGLREIDRCCMYFTSKGIKFSLMVFRFEHTKLYRRSTA